MTIQLYYAFQAIYPILNFLARHTHNVIGQSVIEQIQSDLIYVQQYNNTEYEKRLYSYIRDNIFPKIHILEVRTNLLSWNCKNLVTNLLRPIVIILYTEAYKSTYGHKKPRHLSYLRQ